MHYMDNFNSLTSLKITPYIILLALEVIFDVTESASQSEINNHLELGREFLAKSQFSDALTHYHAAVEGDPNNFLTYFKRGTVYLALGKARLALADLDKTLQLKPDFTSARLSRGSVHLKLGNLELAQIDFRNVIENDPYNEEANLLMDKVEPTRQMIDYAYYYHHHGDYLAGIRTLNTVLETCPWSAALRQLRAKCHIEHGDQTSAISDMRSATKLQTDSTEGYLELAKLLYKMGLATEALKEIRECLKLDPEHAQCFPLYKKIKKVEKLLTDANNYLNENEFKECITSAEKILKIDNEEEMIEFTAKQVLCSCLVKDEQSTNAMRVCNEALEISKEPSVYCDRAEAYILSEMYDDAIRDYQAALELDKNYGRANEGLQKAQKLQMQAERRDYYKILGVKRTATKKEIIKAYRKAAQKWHPDNYRGDEKKIAEKKFIDIAAAKEVLTDEEKRAQFDRGEDPLDPEQNRYGGQGGNPFHHFHTGSPFQFRFHFN